MARFAIAFCFFIVSLQSLRGSPFPSSSSSSSALENQSKTLADYNSDDYYTSDDDYLDEQEKVVHRTPKFTSQSTNVLINEGDVIKLPCFVDKLDGFVLLWKKGKTIIAVGKSLISKDDARIRLEETESGNTLVISLAEPEDAGEYLCAISANKPTELRHSVRIRVAPEIVSVPVSGHIVVREGDPAVLACQVVRGSPTPEVTWKRKERRLPSGEDEIRGLTLSYPKATRHHSGHYICSADNGFAEPATAHISLDVQHAPTIEQEQMYIHTRENDETEVVCIVHASPKADVVWLKNGQVLTKDQGIVSHRANRHTLLLPGIKGSTFGSYTCKATNKFGSDEKTTEVSGKAGPVNFKSAPEGEEKNSYALEWVAQSITPVIAFRLQYKQVDESYMEPARMKDPMVDEAAPSGWTEVRVAPLNNGDHFYSGKFHLDNLDAAAHYAARVSSQNSYGFSPFSPVFKFGTKGAVALMNDASFNHLAPVQQPSTGNGCRSGHALPHHMMALLLTSTFLARIMFSH